MYRNFKTFNRAKFRNDIYNENWEFLDSCLDLSQMWTEWKTKILKIVDKRAPICTKRVRSKSCPWITAGLKERMHNRDTLKIKAMIRTIGPTSKEWVRKLILKLKLLKNYFTIISSSKPMVIRVKHGKPSTILHLVRPSIKRLEK